ncbi:hypothetical protein QJQ45_010628 [Haematococcus lacustris]|nr:hypothetical protein QJQ45_010628 [Haematococcus lacustris]
MDKSSADGASTGQQLQSLQGLPAELLGAVLRQLDASSRLQVFRSSKLLATAVLRISPNIHLTYPTQHDIQRDNLRELAPFLTEVLRNRQQPKLQLTLQRDYDLDIATLRRKRQRARLVARMLGAVPLCGAVDCLAIGWHEDLELPWEPAFSAALAESFPSLTSLTFTDVRISIGHLAQAISHPRLVPRLVHLDLQGILTAHGGDQLHMSPFIGSRLQTLSLGGWVEVDGERDFLYGLVDVPFPPHLTQLEVTGLVYMDLVGWVRLAAAVRSLTQLQELSIDCHTTKQGPTALLLALAHLPNLHTLKMEGYVEGQQQLHALLKLTQITRLEVKGFSGLTSSQASADCSWRELRIWRLDWVSAAYLPLHSITHPQWLRQLVTGNGEPSIELLAAAELNLCECNKAGLEVEDMWLSQAAVDLLTEQYLSHICPADHQAPHPTVASSSSHSGPSTSLASSSSSPEGHITPGGPGSITGQGGQALMQRLGHRVKALPISVNQLGDARLSSANQQALAALFPTAKIGFVQQR